MRFGKLCVVAMVALFALGSTALAQDAKPAKVLVLPFEAVGPDQAEKGWIARALQQNLMAELTRLRSVEPAAGTATAADLAAAAAAGEAGGAKYVVFGSYQAVQSDLRITGQVVDVTSKQAVAGLKATGTLRDLFGLEDVIAQQVKRALPQAAAPAAPEAKAEMLEHPRPAPGIVPRGPIEIGRAGAMADELADEMGRAIERIRYRNTWQDDSYYDRGYRRPYRYGYGYGYPYYGYPIYWTGPVYVPSGGGIIGKAPHTRYAGRTELGRERLSFPSYAPQRKFPKKN